ncbi:MAG: Trp family transcriptional regulator [Candidatus Paceibacteria bacterium]
MTNISKFPLSKEQENELFDQLGILFSNRSADATQGLFRDLLGPEEKIMLAKRLAIIILLHKKQSLYFIAQTLHVSPATVARQQDLLEENHYGNIIACIAKPTPSIIGFLQAIDDILHLGGILPHYGETHASELYKKDRAALRQREK